MQKTSDWLDSQHTRPDGSQAHIRTRWAVLTEGVETHLVKDAMTLVSHDDAVMVVCDQRTLAMCIKVEEAFKERHIETVRHHVPDKTDGSSPSADDKSCELLEKRLQESGTKLAVSVGSGTVNDITKYATSQVGIPYLSYATAASMNGYTSGIAALYVKGLKATVQATPPLGVYADPAVIAEAPNELNLAGLGDLCSKPFAGADAIIAGFVTGITPWRLPSQMVEEVFERALQDAAAIGQKDPRAIADLMEALWVSGFSMCLADSSAPASGGEHLWSHRLDMERHDAGLPPQSYHGTQVGIACGLVKALFDSVGELDEETITERLAQAYTEPDPQEQEALAAWLAERHPELSEGSREAVQREASKKYDRTWRDEVRKGLKTHWSAIQKELHSASAHAARVDLALERAGAPRKPQDIGVSQEDSDRILRVCRDIRNRLTILDLAADLLP